MFSERIWTEMLFNVLNSHCTQRRANKPAAKKAKNQNTELKHPMAPCLQYQVTNNTHNTPNILRPSEFGPSVLQNQPTNQHPKQTNTPKHPMVLTSFARSCLRSSRFEELRFHDADAALSAGKTLWNTSGRFAHSTAGEWTEDGFTFKKGRAKKQEIQKT